MSNAELEALVERVREQLEHWDSSGFEHVTLAVPVADLRALCDEVELLRDARDAGRMLNDVRQAGLTRLTAEVERLTRERDAVRSAVLAEVRSEVRKMPHGTMYGPSTMFALLDQMEAK